MITDKDIEKIKASFKDTFVTKEEFHATLEDAFEKFQHNIHNELRLIVEIIGEQNNKLDKALEEISTHRIVLGNHEQRIKTIERYQFE